MLQNTLHILLMAYVDECYFHRLFAIPTAATIGAALIEIAAVTPVAISPISSELKNFVIF